MISNKLRIFQIVYGLILILFGLNAVFAFLPIPEKQGLAYEFLHILHQVGYMMPTIAIIMVTAGLLLVFNRWVNFGLIILLPVSFNIFAFHLFHDWPGLVAAAIIFFTNIFLVIKRFNQFKILINQ